MEVPSYPTLDKHIFGIASSLGIIGALEDEAIQLIDCCQPPVGVPGQAQVAAVLPGLAPGHVLAVVPPGPHESCGGINPRPTHLRDRKSTRLNSSHLGISYA